MHYYVDGYNLLFRFSHAEASLQKLRNQIIQDLNNKASLLQLNISIVFDSHYQEGRYERSHFGGLEILFTNQGETADEFILKEIQESLNPNRETVITSDKALARQARSLSAHTETIEQFIKRLNQSYLNKQNKQKRIAKSENIVNTFQDYKKKQSKQADENISHSEIQDKPVHFFKPKADLEYYDYIFNIRFEQQFQEKQNKKIKKPTKIPKKTTKKIPPFDNTI